MTQYTSPELVVLGKAEVLTKAFIGGTILDADCQYRDGWA